LLAAAAGLYFAAAEFAPLDRIDACSNDRLFWAPVAAALVAAVLVLIHGPPRATTATGGLM